MYKKIHELAIQNNQYICTPTYCYFENSGLQVFPFHSSVDPSFWHCSSSL